MNRVVHFEIHADDTDRAVAFYRRVFGWKIDKWGGPVDYWTVTTGPDSEPGINGGIVKRRGVIDGTAVIAYVCTIEVESVDAFSGKISAGGGSSVLPKMAIPGVGWLAYFKDTEGNIFGIMENDVSAG